MKDSLLLFIDVKKKIRVDRLVNEYAGFNVSLLESAIRRISQRLGGLNMKLAIDSLNNKDFKTSASILLDYYDKAYLKGVSDRDPSKVIVLSLNSGVPEINSKKVLEFYNREIKSKFHLFDKSFQQ